MNSGWFNKTELTVAQRLEFYSMPEPNTGCHLWFGGALSTGYGRLKVNGVMQRAHRLAWEQAKGPIPAGLCVCHSCDTPSCINPEHLFLGTQADNTADKMRKNRHFVQRGEKHGIAKLTEEAVITIRASDERQQDLARRFGVSDATISDIKKRKNWKHV